jgi:hypothetical protein
MSQDGSKQKMHKEGHEHERGIVMSKNLSGNSLGRWFIVAGLFLLAGLFSWEAFAADVNVVDVRRNIPLADDAPIYKDFYLNGGNSDGLKQNMVVTVFRKLSVRDATGTTTYGDVEIPVGQLKVIMTAGRVAVAREYKLIPRDDQPMLEQTGIMIGDRVDFQGSFIDKK